MTGKQHQRWLAKQKRVCDKAIAMISTGDEKVVRLGDLAAACSLTAKATMEILESDDKFVVNVAIRCGNGIANLRQSDYLVERNP